MNGHELFYKLSQLSSAELDLPVYSEGCDCTEPAEDLKRHDGYYDAKGQPTINALVVTRA